MCGINGIFSLNKEFSPIKKEELLTTRDNMFRRGPDSGGFWISKNNRIGLGHRRLSIIDLSSAGNQPMFTENMRYAIVFNGEIYNFQLLKDKLKEKGVKFQSYSDTEVLLKLYVEYGEGMLNFLRGMFAFAIYDSEKEELFVARDQLGIKPLYYSFQDGVFRFASQVKALLAGNQIKTTPSAAGRVGFFLWGHIPEPFTLYNEILSIPAGSYLKLKVGDSASIPIVYFKLKDIWIKAAQQNLNFSSKEKVEYLREVLLDSIEHHLIADVPVGIFLSSGLDSTTITALASEKHQHIKTITLGFNTFKNTVNDETILANDVAKHYKTEHSVYWVNQNEFYENLETILDVMDQPSIDGINTFFVCKAAAKAGLKVVLSGVGGDELFGSYPSFKSIPKMFQWGKQINKLPFIKTIFQNIVFPIFKKNLPKKVQFALNYTSSIGSTYFLSRSLFLPEFIKDTIDQDEFKIGFEELMLFSLLNKDIEELQNYHSQISVMETKWYLQNQLLRDTDWAGMAHSLEVRTPFVDVELISRIAPLFLSSEATSKKQMALTPKLSLLPEILNKSKTGFNIPVTEWLLKEYPEFKSKGYEGWAKFVYTRFTT